MKAPPRAIYLRALMAELERLANHFGDIGAICNDASFSLMHAQCGILRERTLRAAEASFGHRLMMDAIVPGGVARDIAAEGIVQVEALLAEVRRVFPRLIELYDNTASLQDRTVSHRHRESRNLRGNSAPAALSAAPRAAPSMRGGPSAYPPYDKLSFEVPVLDAGDVNARVWIRIREIEQSLSLIEQILGRAAERRAHRLRSAKARLAKVWASSRHFAATCWSGCGSTAKAASTRCHLRDASWFQWPLLEAAIEGNIVADFPLCNKSFNCSYSGHDL